MTDTGWPDDADAAERVRHVALTRTEPRNAGWIAEEANVSRDTAVKYLRRLVETDELETVETGDGTGYRPDPVTQFLSEVRRLAEEHTLEELTRELDAIDEEIDDWRGIYEVDSLEELRTSLGRDDLDPADRRERLAVAEEWEYDRDIREAIRLAIGLQNSLATLDVNSLAGNASSTLLQEG
jgi:predicted ArsR family transcriptional regulator